MGHHCGRLVHPFVHQHGTSGDHYDDRARIGCDDGVDAQKKREKKGTSAEEINRMATKSTRNVGTSSKARKELADPAKEEKIRQAQESAMSAKPGSLTSKAYLVSRYNSGQKTEDKAPEDTEDKADKSKDKKRKK